ncbi:alpha/beta hydrolase [Aliiroseovarius lamellibrachiae]|uniref:alpha/beta hydrolase n=1 Tax=Aliiroseovarius lamellibrachiae TaxID=1924933 RepID=UPI001BDFEF8B|nr:alpha/beta hydrolase [Aliiroseovarius lamellibrachiae]MBT2131738.1 alpha/beta hydrolase [Aliiroseovarius lamellibrachiae]
MDYEKLIDKETWAFIRKTEDYYPPDATVMSIAEQRKTYDTMCRAFFQGYPNGVSVRDGDAQGVPIRIYEATAKNEIDAPGSDATVIYYHGGGFVVGGLDSHDDVCAEICDRTGLRVVSADYRLCPENPHPAAFEDAWTTLNYVSLTWPGVTVLVGDSAGGNLAAAVSHHARGKVPVAGQVLIYPGLGGDMTQGSYMTHAKAPMLSTEEVRFYHSVRHGTSEIHEDPTAAPLTDSNFAGLPRSVIFTAQCDPLADDGRMYRDRIRAAGGRAHWVEEPGLVHGYLRARSTVPRAKASFDRILVAISALSQENWPF